MRLDIRKMAPRDVPQVVEIDRASFNEPWSRVDFHKALRGRGYRVVAVNSHSQGHVVGYAVCTIHKMHIQIERIAVAPECREEGVGRAIVGAVKLKHVRLARRYVTAAVLETNTLALRFFSSAGLKPTYLLRGYLGDTNAYWMRYSVPGFPAKVVAAGNRFNWKS